MNTLLFMDLLSLTFALAALVRLAFGKKSAEGFSRLPLVIIILGVLLVTGVQALKHVGLVFSAREYERYSEVLALVGFLFFFVLFFNRVRDLTRASRMRVLGALHAITEKLPLSAEPRVLWRELLGRIINVMGYQAGALFLRDEDGVLHLRTDWHLDRALQARLGEADLGASILGRVLETQEPLLVESTESFPDGLIQSLSRAGVQSLAVFPLVTEGQVPGVTLILLKDPHPFSSEEADLFALMGRHLGGIILNNRLLAESHVRSAELIQALESKKHFLSLISHELRDPLTVIKGTFLLFQQHLSQGLTNELSRALEVAARNTQMLERLIEDILDLARMDSGKLELEFVPVDPGKELHQLGEEARRAASRKGLILNMDIPETLSPLEVDRLRFHQVVRNLLTNAVKFTPEGGLVTLGAEEEGESLLVRVTDNGIGISEEDLPRIFEMFFRVRGSRATEPGGAGLGLALVNEIVRLHDGRIFVKSTPGSGTTFTISLPRVHLP